MAEPVEKRYAHCFGTLIGMWCAPVEENKETPKEPEKKTEPSSKQTSEERPGYVCVTKKGHWEIEDRPFFTMFARWVSESIDCYKNAEPVTVETKKVAPPPALKSSGGKWCDIVLGGVKCWD